MAKVLLQEEKKYGVNAQSAKKIFVCRNHGYVSRQTLHKLL